MFINFIAPSILILCGIFMLNMGIRWSKNGNYLKGIMDIIAGVGFIIIAVILPQMR